jgi:hypothetical protein
VASNESSESSEADPAAKKLAERQAKDELVRHDRKIELAHRNLSRIIDHHQVACQKVETAIITVKEAMIAVAQVGKISLSMNDSILSQFGKRIRLQKLLQDLNTAQARLSASVRQSRNLTASNAESIRTQIESGDSNFE